MLADDWAGVVPAIHRLPIFPGTAVTRGRIGRHRLSRAGRRRRGCGSDLGLIFPGSPILIPDRQRDKKSRKKPAADFLNGFVHANEFLDAR